jgi:hypothetical protein
VLGFSIFPVEAEFAPSRPADHAALGPVIAAARECFSRAGVEATRMEDVARRAGISRQHLYRFVSGRAELLELAFLERLHDRRCARHHRHHNRDRERHPLAELSDPSGRGVPTGTVTIEPQLAHVQATDRGSSFISTGQSQAWGGQPPAAQASRRLGASAFPLSLRAWGCGVVMYRAFQSSHLYLCGTKVS